MSIIITHDVLSSTALVHHTSSHDIVLVHCTCTVGYYMLLVLVEQVNAL